MLASRIIQIDTFWLARPDRLKALISDSTLIDVKAFYGIDIEALSVAPSLFVNGSVAHIDISGYMIKKVPLIWKYYDIAATSTSSSMIEAVLKDVENERVIVCPSATPDEVVKSTRWFAL